MPGRRRRWADMSSDPTIERRAPEAPGVRKAPARQRRSLAVVFFGTGAARRGGRHRGADSRRRRLLDLHRDQALVEVASTASLRAVLGRRSTRSSLGRDQARRGRALGCRPGGGRVGTPARRRLARGRRARGAMGLVGPDAVRQALAPFFADRDSVAINAVDRDGRILARRVSCTSACGSGERAGRPRPGV